MSKYDLKAPFRLKWFIYWTIFGRGHPDHIKWYEDAWKNYDETKVNK